MMKSLVVETPTNFTQRFITPSGIMENDVPQKFGDPQSYTIIVEPNGTTAYTMSGTDRLGTVSGDNLQIDFGTIA